MDSSDQLLKIIDDRTKKNISPNIVYRTSMIVTSIIDDTKIKAVIPGYTTEYTFLNKTGENLFVGDNVIIESNGTNLNNGLVVYRFGATINPFVNATYENSWVTHNISVCYPASYRLTGKMVSLRGLVKDGTAGSTIFTLPSTMRPTKQLLIPTVANNAFGVIEINSDGTVKNRVGATNYVSLDGISYELD